MKYCIIIPDGMADHADKALDGKTPLESAIKPHIDHVAISGRLGAANMIPEGMAPESATGLLSLMGTNPAESLASGGALEAAGLGVALGANETAFRCTLVTAKDNSITEPSAGHISTDEGTALINSLNERLGSDDFRFHAGEGHRHLLICRNIEAVPKCMPPYTIVGDNFEAHLPHGHGEGVLRMVMERARGILEQHDVNLVRIDHGESPANMLWLWAGGKKPFIRQFADVYGKSGAIVTATPLVRGLAKHLNMEVIRAPLSTSEDNYKTKAQLAVAAFKKHDLVILHDESPDAASHDGDVKAKVVAINNVDRLIVGPILETMTGNVAFRMLVASNHLSATLERTHTSEPVPFAMCGTQIEPVHAVAFSEKNAAATGLRIEHGHELMAYFLRE